MNLFNVGIFILCVSVGCTSIYGAIRMFWQAIVAIKDKEYDYAVIFMFGALVLTGSLLLVLGFILEAVNG